MLSRAALVFLFVVVLAVAEKCLNVVTRRTKIQYYFDPAEWTCFALPTDCTTDLKVSYKLYDSEEECTLQNMVRLWKSYRLSCAPGHRMAVYKRTNGDLVPHIFSSRLCHGTWDSDICERDEVCHSHGGFGYCCKVAAFMGDGPNGGTFNFTGLGGKNAIVSRKMSTPSPLPTPKDCNLDGKRKEIEWYPANNMACLSRRRTCKSPGFPKQAFERTYPTQKECHDAHFPNLRMTYRLTCMPGYTAATTKDVALIFSKDQCGSAFHSDVCNRDEYCAYKNTSPYAFCCARSDKHHVIQYSVFGKNYWHRQKRMVVLM